jgi:hypothetical protein
MVSFNEQSASLKVETAKIKVQGGFVPVPKSEIVAEYLGSE